jgi:prefoldin subunit 5
MKSLEEMIKEKIDKIEACQVRMNFNIRKIEREQRELGRQLQVLQLRQNEERRKVDKTIEEIKLKYF